MPRLTKILVANRGEIAVRVLRTLRAMGRQSVAVYSDADAQTQPVRLADEAVGIGPSPSTQSYLRADVLIEAALRSGAQAIHPGYGFLSEQASFARAVEAAGLVFLGPTPENIEALGDKSRAHETLGSYGIQPVPGNATTISSVDELQSIAQRVGFPVALKAAAGGGGKGIRILHSPSELDDAWTAARAEAQSAFGSEAMILERYLVKPRHIEVQVLGDGKGGVRVFYERDCSTQRRLQKILEETPSPVVTPQLREKLLVAVSKAIAATRYRSAGTLEFLLSNDGELHFLEMNTRIQVEHPLTEMTTGWDLVREQIEVAEGKMLPPWQGDLADVVVEPQGAAVEFRVNAEDPSKCWLPVTGTVRSLRLPGGPSLRVDSALEVGATVSTYYDSLLAKVIAHASDRPEAFARLAVALDEMEIGGLVTNLPLGRVLCRDAAVLAGQHHCQHLETQMATDGYFPAPLRAEDLPLVAAAASWLRRQERAARRAQARHITKNAGRDTWKSAAETAWPPPEHTPTYGIDP